MNNFSGIKVLICTGIYPPSIGGPATYSKLLFDELPKYGFKVEILSYDKVRQWPKGISHLVYFFMCLSKAVGKNVLYAQDPVSVGLPSFLVSKLLGKKFMIRVAGDYAWEQAVQRCGVKESIDDFQKKQYRGRVDFLRRMQGFVVRRAHLVITPSFYFKKLVEEWGREKEVVAIYNGIEPDGFSEIIPDLSSHQIVSVGRMVPWKGFETLIEILPRMTQWRLVIVGDGPQEEKLRSLAKSLQVADRVEFTGPVSREDLKQILRGSEIFILNTRFESFSFITIEAMASGLPVAVSRVGSLPELVEDGKDGFLFKPDDKEAICDILIKIDNDEDLRNVLSDRAREKSRNFSIEKTLEKLSQAIKNICGTHLG